MKYYTSKKLANQAINKQGEIIQIKFYEETIKLSDLYIAFFLEKAIKVRRVITINDHHAFSKKERSKLMF